MGKKILIKNVKVTVPCDGEDRAYRDANILIEGPKTPIISRDLMNGGSPVSGRNLNQKGTQAIRTKGKFVYPSLINTHHHFLQTFVRNPMTIDYPNMVVMDWVDKIYHIFQNIDSDVIYYSTLIFFADLMKHGCACTLDHQYCYTRRTGRLPVDRQMEAAELLGTRYHAGKGASTLPESEGNSILDNMPEATDEFLKDCDRLVGLYHDSGPLSMRQVVMAPCQSVNCRRRAFAETMAVTREKGVRTHTYLGGGESEGAMARWSKCTMNWCGEMGFIREDVWYAHDWEMTKEEYRVLATTSTGVPHCPAPAILSGSPILNIKEIREAGILVSLGRDDSAINDNPNLLDVLRTACLMQANHTEERGGCVSAYGMLKVATVSGAKTLGRGNLGSLEAGKTADPFMIDTETLGLAGALRDPKNPLVRVGLTGSVWVTMINGSIVYKDGILKNVNERKLVMEGEAVCTRAIRELHGAYREFI